MKAQTWQAKEIDFHRSSPTSGRFVSFSLKYQDSFISADMKEGTTRQCNTFLTTISSAGAFQKVQELHFQEQLTHLLPAVKAYTEVQFRHLFATLSALTAEAGD